MSDSQFAVNFLHVLVGLNFVAALFVFSRHTDSRWLQRKRFLTPAVLLPYVAAVFTTREQIVLQFGVQIVCLTFVLHTLILVMREGHISQRRDFSLRKTQQDGRHRRLLAWTPPQIRTIRVDDPEHSDRKG